ncbi:MAG: glycosyltransferase [Steroidobacteraceae bacterium]
MRTGATILGGGAGAKPRESVEEGAKYFIVVPSAKVGGGIREAFRLGRELVDRGAHVRVLAMWISASPMDSALDLVMLSTWMTKASHAIVQIPLLIPRFRRWLKASDASGPRSRARFLFTHYATLPLSMFVPRSQRYYFVQDLEWKFVRRRYLAASLRWVIVYFYRRGTIVSANAYLTAGLREVGLSADLEMPIWADERFAALGNGRRDIDFVMVLRKGAHKRLDLYLSFIELAKGRPELRVAVITPESAIAAAVRERVAECLQSPTLERMRALYARSKCFVHLSEHEGFGLPPLEAMGAGCVPLCRDSGGVRAYMHAPGLQELLLEREAPLQEIFRCGCVLIADGKRLERLMGTARAVFQEGVRGSRHSRESTLEALLEHRAASQSSPRGAHKGPGLPPKPSRTRST